jgi:1-deoxy-D-xylulose-5-phosphate reductoisomerase
MMTHQPQPLVVLGSTGSVGQQTLALLPQLSQHFSVLALTGGQNVALLHQQLWQYRPSYTAVATPHAEQALLTLGLPPETTCLGHGAEALLACATLPQAAKVVVGLVGFVGLPPTLAALQAGKQVLTANKETFVAGGALVKPYLSQIIPLDSEHSAIYQCLQGQEATNQVQTLWLTSSGGPFRTTPKAELAHVTPAQALKHPNWSMGAKVTIDSATLMNKGLEVIEAYWLFGQPLSAIEVVVHPQSVVHSAVQFVDGQLLAQLGPTDMRLPILYGLGYPQRLPAPPELRQFNWLQASPLTFEAPDTDRFPALALARQALVELGPLGGTVINAADEVLVEAFLAEKLSFNAIAQGLEAALTWASTQPLGQVTLDTITLLDAEVRQQVIASF